MRPSVRITEVYGMDEDTKLEVNPEACSEMRNWRSFKNYFPVYEVETGSATRGIYC